EAGKQERLGSEVGSRLAQSSDNRSQHAPLSLTVVLAFFRIRRVKRVLVLLVTVVLAGSSFGCVSSGSTRTISNISSIPQRVLQRSISPKFYQSLLISPVEGYIAVRGQLDGNRLS